MLENQNDVPYGQYFYIDYELYREPLAEGLAYFHAHWRRENPCRGWAPRLQVNSPEINVPHLDAAGNYVVVETTGCGHYVGCNLSVTCPSHLRGPLRVQVRKRVLIRLIQKISELLWKPLASDFPGTKQCARNTSTEKSNECRPIPAKTSSRQKRFAKGTTQ